MASKVCTAQEMREAADAMSHGCDSELVVADADEYGLHINRNKTFEVASMLRQAADAEDELTQLKARLEAVVKVAKNSGWRLRDCDNETYRETHNLAIREILRAARGEGGEK